MTQYHRIIDDIVVQLNRKSLKEIMVNFFINLLILLTISFLSVTAYADEPEKTFTYKDWLLVCDNGNTCQAVGYSNENRHENSTMPAALVFQRKAGKHTELTALLYLAFYDDTPLTKSPYHLWLNNKDLGTITEDKPLGKNQVTALLASLPNTAKITITDGTTTWTVSDKGFNAVFRKMDEIQGRLHTPGAVIVKGKQAESSVPDAPVVPTIHKHTVIDKNAKTIKAGDPLFEKYISLLNSVFSQHCDTPVGFFGEEVSFELARLTDQHSLLLYHCWAAAYNFGDVAIVVNNTQPFQPQVVDSSITDYHNGELGVSMKGRGIGDCWSRQSWVYDGKQFVLSEVYDTGLCRGIPGGVGPLNTYSTHIVTD